MSIELLLDLMHPCFEDSPQLLKNALDGAQVLNERPSLFWRMGRERATLFSYTLYQVLSREPTHQTEKEGVIAGLKKAYPTLKESFTQNRALNIILEEREKISYYSPDFRIATIEQERHAYQVQQAYYGYLRREAERFNQTFARSSFSRPAAAPAEAIRWCSMNHFY